jgi:two-component system, chemotaxis family, sensor kinase CheA
MSTSHDDAEIIATARAGFLDEAAELLQQFELALLALEGEPGNAEHLNAAFRAAHTIKGTAGLFGLEPVVAFTHEVETLMESLRSGARAFDDTVAAVLLESQDQMAVLIEEVRSGASDPAVAARSQALAARLRELQAAASVPAAPPAAPSAAPAAATSSLAGEANWQLTLQFGADALRNGLDPLAFVRYLSRIGRVVRIQTRAAQVPALHELDPESCVLGFEIALDGPTDRAEIERVFEFAQDDCVVEIVGADAAAGSASAHVDHVAAVPAVPAVPAVAHAPATATPHVAAVERRSAATDRRAAGRGDETRYVRVRADKLDHLIDLIGELVIASSGARMAAQDSGAAPAIEATQRVADLVQSTRDGALALRMVPVGETFARFQRVVRDLGKQLGKDIELVVTGGDTELDKAMVDVIADPLMHLVRNSVDHGLESPAERAAAGKPATGRLGLNAFHEGGAIIIEVSDDGRGLNRERIVAKATERGLIEPGVELSDAEAWQLIFAPGFSTADKVTDVSGRGVGMDVVKRNIESLRGHIALASQPGRGTTMQIRLPLTLAMIDGFLTQVGGVHYVLPLDVVAECIDVPPECRHSGSRPIGTFDLRGEVLPYIDLAPFYGVAPAGGRRRSLVLVRGGLVRIGLIVDRLLGEHQTVIKPLAGLFAGLKALAGSTILGSGDVALVLDVQSLVAEAQRAGVRALPAGPRTATPPTLRQ